MTVQLIANFKCSVHKSNLPHRERNPNRDFVSPARGNVDCHLLPPVNAVPLPDILSRA